MAVRNFDYDGTACRGDFQALRPGRDKSAQSRKLGPGMAVTVEIKTGARTIISYLLSPLARYKQESLRER